MQLYLASFDVADPTLALGTLTLATAGKPNIVVNLATVSQTTTDGTRTTTVWNHYPVGLGQNVGEDIAATITAGNMFANISFMQKLTALLQTAAGAAGWVLPANLSVNYSTATNRYFILYVTASITATFSTTGGAKLLGYATTTPPSGFTVLGTRAPNFSIETTLQGVSLPTPNYEAQDISSQSISAAGSWFGMSRSCAPIYRDWIQQFEIKAKTMRLSAVAAHPFTLQELFERSRTRFPFVVVQGFGESFDEVFLLRAETSSFAKDVVSFSSEASDVQYHVNFKTAVLGVPAP